MPGTTVLLFLVCMVSLKCWGLKDIPPGQDMGPPISVIMVFPSTCVKKEERGLAVIRLSSVKLPLNFCICWDILPLAFLISFLSRALRLPRFPDFLCLSCWCQHQPGLYAQSPSLLGETIGFCPSRALFIFSTVFCPCFFLISSTDPK